MLLDGDTLSCDLSEHTSHFIFTGRKVNKTIIVQPIYVLPNLLVFQSPEPDAINKHKYFSAKTIRSFRFLERSSYVIDGIALPADISMMSAGVLLHIPY
jgi:hypothetical protein